MGKTTLGKRRHTEVGPSLASGQQSDVRWANVNVRATWDLIYIKAKEFNKKGERLSLLI